MFIFTVKDHGEVTEKRTFDAFDTLKSFLIVNTVDLFEWILGEEPERVLPDFSQAENLADIESILDAYNYSWWTVYVEEAEAYQAQKKARLCYRDGGALVVLGAITTNRSLSVEDALDLLGIDLDDYFIGVMGWDDWDYNALEIDYSQDGILTPAFMAAYNKVARVELDTDSQWEALAEEVQARLDATGAGYYEVPAYESKSGRPEIVYLED